MVPFYKHSPGAENGIKYLKYEGTFEIDQYYHHQKLRIAINPFYILFANHSQSEYVIAITCVGVPEDNEVLESHG